MIPNDPFRYRDAPPFELSDKQNAALKALADTLIAPLTKEEEDALVLKLKDTHPEEEVRGFCRFAASSVDCVGTTQSFISRTVLQDKRQELLMVLSLLATRAGTFVLTGHFAEFKDLSKSEREKALLNWKNSYLPHFRLLYKTFHSLICHPLYSNYPELFKACLKYNPASENQVYENVPAKLPVLEDIEDGTTFDVIVVGSGAGGGVIASELAKAGKSVLVIEKGKYYHESEFGTHEGDAFQKMYENGGVSPSHDGAVHILAGSVLGGGTTVNWAASLKLQHFVREEWAKQGLTHFLSPKFSRDLDRVFERIGATAEGIVHNGSNQVLIDGCKALGYPVADIPQNTSGKEHRCEFCFAGCRGGIKNGSMNTWLRDACEHNAKILPQTKVMRVLIKKKKAVGVECIVNYTKKVNLFADQIVVAAGSMQSPGVLLRSGLKNKNIGRHLKLHPCTISFGVFDRPIRTYEGSIMTVVSSVSENVDKEGYGVKLEVPCLPPGSISAVLPWRGSAHHKELMLKYENISPILVLCRDKDSKGVVRYDDKDNQMVEYNLSKHDRASMLHGLISSLNILVAAGARQVHTGQFGVEPFIFKPEEMSRVDNPNFIAWIQKVKKYGLPNEGFSIFCAHQMGTNRMGVSPKVSVTKPTGETWEVRDLYVGDASLLPTATGVNPMVTVEAVALNVADSIINSKTSKL